MYQRAHGHSVSCKQHRLEVKQIHALHGTGDRLDDGLVLLLRQAAIQARRKLQALIDAERRGAPQ